MQEPRQYAKKILDAADKFLEKKMNSKIQSISDKEEFSQNMLENISEDIGLLFEEWIRTKNKDFEGKSIINIFEDHSSTGKIDDLNIELAQCLIFSESLEYAAYKPLAIMAVLMGNYGFNWTSYLESKIMELGVELNSNDIAETDDRNCDKKDSFGNIMLSLRKIFILCKIMKLKDLVPCIIDACVATSKYTNLNDMLGWEARSCLLEIGQDHLEVLYEKLKNLSTLNPVCEQLMLCLAELGANKKKDELFKFFREFFKKYQDKVFASDCLVRYNDSRAVIVIRGYIERNIHSLDKNSFYELKSAVDKLGGQTRDIVNMYLSHNYL